MILAALEGWRLVERHPGVAPRGSTRRRAAPPPAVD
jgi:hypothetical protein